MDINVFRSKDNQKQNYVTTWASEEDVDKSHYEFIGRLHPDFESEDTISDDSLILGKYSEDELVKKIQTFPGYVKSIEMLKNLKERPVPPVK
jgi:hypothetical protein